VLLPLGILRVAGDANESPTPIIGLFGAVAGDLLGREAKWQSMARTSHRRGHGRNGGKIYL